MCLSSGDKMIRTATEIANIKVVYDVIGVQVDLLFFLFVMAMVEAENCIRHFGKMAMEEGREACETDCDSSTVTNTFGRVGRGGVFDREEGETHGTIDVTLDWRISPGGG